MGVLADWQIGAEGIVVSEYEKYDAAKQLGKISWGLASYGYDARVGNRFRVFRPYPVVTVDPKNFDSRCYDEVVVDDHIIVPAHSYVLGESVETFCIPRSVLCIVVGKSTYARCGLLVNVTPGEPEWVGRWTIEISNSSPAPVKVYANEGIMQCIFIRTDALARVKKINWRAELERRQAGDRDRFPITPAMIAQIESAHETCLVSYRDKKGKYQNQQGLMNAAVTTDAQQLQTAATIGHCAICHSVRCHHPNNHLYHDPELKYPPASSCIVCKLKVPS